jgi:hypothetical protein
LGNCFYSKLSKHQIKIWNEKKCNETQNLIWNETKVPHA